ncbi:hypothetical protein POTOM_032307 [Populus tomentosa]|uniref:Uncharacterized protein n=1 Tax=Populus tomentosa TaxID=118781 RepID=A0A8X7Z9W5_POPTO|nr:hypothetical protein POTOM_032307 [Populus tomentosa]
MYSSTVSMLMDVVSDGKIILCFCEEVLKMGISIEISFSAQQCCGGLSSKPLGCYNSCHAVGSTVHIVKSDQLLDSVIKVTMLLYRIQIPTSVSQLLCPGEILLMCEEI